MEAVHCAICGRELDEKDVWNSWKDSMLRCGSCRVKRDVIREHLRDRARQLAAEEDDVDTSLTITEVMSGRYERPFSGFHDIHEIDKFASSSKLWPAEAYLNGEHLTQDDKKLLQGMNVAWETTA